MILFNWKLHTCESYSKMIEKIFLVAVLSTVMVSGILGQWGSCMNEAVLGKTCLNVTNMGAEVTTQVSLNS